MTCPEPEGWSRTGWEISQGWTLASDLWEETFPHLKKMKTRTFSGERQTIFPSNQKLNQKLPSPLVWCSCRALADFQCFLSGFYSKPFCTPKFIDHETSAWCKSYPKWVYWPDYLPTVPYTWHDDHTCALMLIKTNMTNSVDFLHWWLTGWGGQGIGSLTCLNCWDC